MSLKGNWIFIVIFFMVFAWDSTEFENLSHLKFANQSSNYTPTTIAGNAVDGITNSVWPNLAVQYWGKLVWWYVDLGAPRNIHNITIYYRNINERRSQFAGFSLFISNDNFTSKGGYNCNVNSTYPPLIFWQACVNVGRYVTLYNERLFSNPGYGAILELREVEVFGCKNPTVYGPDCNVPCSQTCKNRWCNIINGSCYSCNDGFYGVSCDKTCSAGKYGENCKLDCSLNCVKQLECNHVSGSCVGGCKPGWTGDKCDQSCSDGQYGQNCSHGCGNCQQSSCYKVNGSCDLCAPGYYPSLCKTQCNIGSYGQDCHRRCSWNCKNNDTCNFISGYCTRGCADGWTNSLCSTKCQTGYYGRNCSSLCSANCRNGPVCDHVTGACDQGCNVGYYGPKCAMPCSRYCKNSSNCNQNDGVCINGCKNGYYGLKCSLPCSRYCKDFTFCEDKTGNCIFGCASGWKSEKCNTACAPGEYGENCAYSCGSCVNGTTCNPVSGHCESGCGAGYTGLHCKQACDYGMYGLNCSKNCSRQCLNFETCNIETGKCDKGCTAGYTGPQCDEACADGKYGQNCLVTCGYCLGREACNKISGHCKNCIAEYTLPLCTSSSKYLPLGVGIAIGIGIVTALIIATITGCLLLRRCRNINNAKESLPTCTKDTDTTYLNKDPHHLTKTDPHDYQELGDLSNDIRQYEEIKTQ